MSTLVGAFIKAIRRLVGRKNDTDAEHVSSLAVAVVPDCPSSTSSLGDVFDQDDDEEPLQALPSSVLSSVDPTTDHKVTSTTSSLYSSDSGGEEPDDLPTPPLLPPLSTTSAATAVTADVVLPVTSGGSSSPRRQTAEEEEGGEGVGGSVPDMAAPGPGPGPGSDPSPPRDVVLLREIIEVVDISSDEDSDDDVQLIEVEPRPNAAPVPAQAAAIAVPVKIEQPLPQHPPALASAQSLDDNPLQRPVFLPTPPLDESPASGPSTDSVIVKSEIMGRGGTAELNSAAAGAAVSGSGAVNITADPLHVIITIPPKYASSYTHPMHVLQTQESSRATTAAAPTPPPQWRRVVPRAEANSSQHPATTVISADDDDGDDLIILEDESTFGGQGHVGQSTMLVTMTDGTSASLPLSPPQSAEEGAASVPMEVESRATMKSNSLPPPQDEGQDADQRMDVDATPAEEVPNAAHINHNEHQTPPQLSSSPISETFSTVGLMREVPKSIAASEQVKEPQGPVTSKSIGAVPVQEDGNADQVERRPPAAASAPSPSGHRFCPFDNKVSNSPTSIYCSEQCLIGHVEDVLAGYTGKGTVWLFHCTTEEMVQQPKENVVNWLLENRLFSVYKPSSKMSSKLPSGKDKAKKSRTMEAANGSNGLLVDHQNHQVAGPSRGRGEGGGSSYISDLENLATVRRGRGRPRKKPLAPAASTSTSPIVEPQEEHLSPIKSLGGASNKKRTSLRVESSSSSSSDSDSDSSSEAEETEDSEDSDDSNDSEDSEDSEQEIIRPIRNEDRKLRLQRRQRRLSRQSNMVEEEDEPEAISMPLARRSRIRPTKSLTTTIASRHQNGSAGSSENDVSRSLPAISRKQLPGGSRRESDQQKSLPPPPPLLQRNHYDHRPAIHPASEKPGKKWNPPLSGYKIGKLSQSGGQGGTPKSTTVSPTSQPLFVRPNSKAVTSCSESRSQMSNGDHAGPSSSGGPSSKSFPKLHLPDIGHLDKADIDGRVSCANSIRDALMNRVPELPPQFTTATTSPPPTLEQVNQLCIAIDAATWKQQANLKAYYMKMRSLLSNIKDASNPDFFVRILRQQVTPAELAKMESRDMASEARKAADRAVQAKTLSMWTQAAEEEVEEAKRRGIRMKKTHKGEREIALDSEDVVSTPDDYITKRDVVTVMDKTNNITARRVTVPVTSAEVTLAAAAASTSNSTSPVVETSPSTPPEEVAASDPNAPISPTGSELSPEDMDIDLGDSPSPPAALSLPPTPISSPSPVGRPIPVRTTTSTSGEKRPAPLGAHPHEPLAKRPSLTEESPLSPEPAVPSALASSTSVFKRSTSLASSSKPYYNGSVGMSISGDPGPSRVISSTPNSVVSSFSNSKLAPLAKLSISLNISKQAPLTSKAASIFCGPLSSSSDSSSSPSPQKKKAPVGAFPAQPHTPTSANQQQQSWSCRPFYMDTNTYSLYRYGVKQCGVAAWSGSLTCTMADFKRTEFTVAATKLYGDWGEVGCYFKDSAIKNCLQVPLRGKWNEIWSSIRSNGTKPEHFAIMRLTPKPTPGDITSYNVLQEFLQHKDRLGTCTLERDGELRFLFILPLGGDQRLPEELIDFVGQDLPPPKDRPHLLLTLMCRKHGDATTSCHGISPTFSPSYSPPFRSPRPPPPPPASAAFSAYGRPSVPFANGGGFYPTNRFPGTLVAPIRPLQPAPPSPYFQRPGGAPSGPGPNLLRPNAPPTNYSQCYPAFPYPHAPPPRFRSRFVPPPNSQVVSCSSSSFPRSTTPLVASVPPQPYQPGGSNGSVTSWTSQGLPPRSSTQSGARQSLPPPPTPTPSPTLSATSSVNDPMADISKEFQEMLFDSEDELPMEMSKSIELVNKTTNQIIHQSVSASGGETGSSGRSGSSAKTGSMSSSGQHQQKSFASPPPSASYPHSSPSSSMAFQNGSQQLHRSPVGPPQSMQQQSPPPNTAVPIIRDPRLERNHQGRPGSGPFGTR